MINTIMTSYFDMIVLPIALLGAYYFIIASLGYFRSFITWTRTWTSNDIHKSLSTVRTKGEWAVVTGCTDGIGLEISKILHTNGFRLLLIGRNMEKLEGLLNQFPDSIAFQCDFSTQMNLDDLRRLLIGKGVSLLVNNAGICHENASFSDLSEKDIEDSIRVNALSPLLITQVVLPVMKEGVIMNVSSGSSLAPCPYLSVYSATKSFMNQWANSLRVELEDDVRMKRRSGRVIVQNYTPYYVATKLSGLSPTLTIPDAKEWTESALSLLGGDDTTGYIFHDMMKWVLTTAMPRVMRERYMADTNRPKQ